MELRMLRYFLAVAEEGNMTKAAQHLHLTQPTLSRQIMQLEEELGVPLLDRKENLALTENGLIMKKRAEEILSLVNKTKNEFTTVLERLSGTIHIGCGEFAAAAKLARILAAFQQQHTNVYFEIHTGDFDTLMQKLKNEELDIIITLQPAVAEHAIDVFSLPWQEQLGIFTDDEALTQHSGISTADIAERPLLGPSSRLEMSFILDWLQEERSSLHFIGEGNTLYNKILLGSATHGLIFSYQPQEQPANPLQHSMHWKPLSPPCHIPLCMSWKKDAGQSDTVKACIAYIKESVSKE